MITPATAPAIASPATPPRTANVWAGPSAPAGYAPSVAERFALYQRAGGIITPVLTAVFAFAMGGIVVAATHHNPFKKYRAIFDGTGRQTHMAGDGDKPPYASVLAAMRDGWRVISLPRLEAAPPGGEHDTAFLKYEFVLEKLVEV